MRTLRTGRLHLPFVLCAFTTLAACSGTRLGPLEVQGSAALVNDGGTPRLWLLTRQEETRESSTPGRGPNRRKLVQVHFDVHAFDPVSARPLWTERVYSFVSQDGDNAPIVGSTRRGRLLGQDGDRVWLVIGREPRAVSATDGRLLDDVARIAERHPEVTTLLPDDPQRYTFDGGLVFMAADAQRYVVRGPDGALAPYTPRSDPPVAITHESVKTPLRPTGDVPLRLLQLGGKWLGLYTARETEDAATDPFGRHLQFPYTVIDEGPLARRTLWWATVDTMQRFDERMAHLTGFSAVEQSPVFLHGRFVRAPGRDTPLWPPDSAGLLIAHTTRIDRAGRFALTHLDTALRRVWTAELPLSDTPSDGYMRTSIWPLPGRLLLAGELATLDGDIVRRDVHVVSVDLATGSVAAWNLPRGGPP
jgi:hypothetical protein